MTALTYTGTAADHKLLLAEGLLDADDDFRVTTPAEAYALKRWIATRIAYDAFHRGYELATHDAAAALKPFEPKPSLVARLLGRLA